ISSSHITTTRGGWGVTYGNSSPTANITVANGVFINATNQVDVNAHVDNTLQVITFVPSLGVATSIAASLGIAESNSLAALPWGSPVTDDHMDVNATNSNFISNTAIAAGYGTDRSGSAGKGLTLTLGFYQSSAKANVAGTVTTAGDLTIHAESINSKDNTRSFASFDDSLTSTKDKPSSFLEDDRGFLDGADFKQGLFNLAFGDKLKQVQFRTGQAKSAFALAFAVATSDNTASALIGQGAYLTIGGHPPVPAVATHPFQISASGTVGAIGNFFGQAAETAIGGAVAYGKDANQANAFIGWNSVADVRHVLSLNA